MNRPPSAEAVLSAFDRAVAAVCDVDLTADEDRALLDLTRLDDATTQSTVKVLVKHLTAA
ncbi:MAG TPA: hypothetical protein VNB24_00845 [Acidimicrobiales bacterium]|nr:hypothetical protein [Acidimicrobiales bacterium]